jgi:hypothetical protein
MTAAVALGVLLLARRQAAGGAATPPALDRTADAPIAH